jgi:uncharacterized protein (UPF0333 family)
MLKMLYKLFMHNRGNVIIETAIMFMMVTMMMAGYIYFTQAIRINTVAKIAAREGAREYAVTNDSAQAEEKTRSELALGGINPNIADVSTKAVGYKRLVTVKIGHGFYIPFTGSYNVELGGGAQYMLEENPEFFQ